MALESSTYINGLVVTNPTGSDNISQGDDHIRLLKTTIKATFPNVTGAVSGSHTAINSAVIAANDATNANTASKLVKRDGSGNFTAGTITAALSGNATTATRLQTARNIGGVSFNGTSSINLPGVNTSGNQSTSGNAATATRLATSRNIGGVSFNGTANINLPGVNTAGNQSTSGNAATASRWAAARSITLTGGVSGTTTIRGDANVSISATVADDSHNHVISNVDGLQAALNAKVDDSQVLTNVPVNAVFTDTNTTYSVGDGGLTTKNFTTALKNKLDGIESGAKGDQTATEIRSLLTTVDGSGSGIDADKVDGYNISRSATGSDANTIYFRT
jgi:hypothetical protein